jgi:hypothetical protein
MSTASAEGGRSKALKPALKQRNSPAGSTGVKQRKSYAEPNKTLRLTSAISSAMQRKGGKPLSAYNTPEYKKALEFSTQQLELHQRRMLVLHRQWRIMLYRLALILLLISFHQSQSPMMACVQDILDYNDHVHDYDQDYSFQAHSEFDLVHDECDLQDRSQCTTTTISREVPPTISIGRAMLIVSYDSHVYIWAMSVAIALASFLHGRHPKLSWKDPSLLLATAFMVPLVVFSALQQARPESSSCIDFDSTPRVEWTRQQHSLHQQHHFQVLRNETQDWHPHEYTRGTPVISIYYVVVMLCMWFMESQERQHWRNMKKLRVVETKIALAKKEEEEIDKRTVWFDAKQERPVKQKKRRNSQTRGQAQEASKQEPSGIMQQ